ncbi:hypothetical protein [Azospirillum sp. SYSU D00513]|uniref:hypothetical protein n=1 Tax=Azospirillum sp. SYSU D00513 TaxID=2812561 RepID=UPI001A967E31|nr:hypothetical protein [Azospirillum sp. SYSU D00513]
MQTAPKDTTALPWARLSRRALSALIDELITELDARDPDPDMEPEEDRGELDHLVDDDRLAVLDGLRLRRTDLFREVPRHA